MRKKWFRQLLRRRIFVILLLVLQGLVLYALIRDTSQLEKWISTALSIISLLVALQR